LLTIDSNGDLGYAARDASGATLVSQGIVSAVCGWAPCIIDYESAIDVLPDAYDDQSNAQRQIIGQFGNGDYAIVTCEGRDYDHSDGWTMDEARAVCKTLGLKYAFNLDGGGSTETVLGKKQINTIYDGTYGRIVPTFIVFNGTTVFGEP
jgi:exopolysaccharide biosynthesis protein